MRAPERGGVRLGRMAFFKTHPPDLLYRGMILLGCFAFVAGVAGIFHFKARDERRRPEADAATVLVRGIEDGRDVEVVVLWEALTASDTRRESETGRLGDRRGYYTFRRVPEGVPLTLVVYENDGGGRREILRQPASLTYGALFETFAAPEPTAAR